MTHEEAVPVLVVEDNKHLRHTLVMQLHALGIKADSAANGMEALRRVYDSEYDLILMDVQMPVMNGLEDLKQQRRSEVLSKQTAALQLQLSLSQVAAPIENNA